MIFVAMAAFCQYLPYKSSLLFPADFSSSRGSWLSLDYPVTILQAPAVILPPGYYVSQLGFFCKQEIRFEKSTKIPLKFRLGGVTECDRLEGKLAR